MANLVSDCCNASDRIVSSGTDEYITASDEERCPDCGELCEFLETEGEDYYPEPEIDDDFPMSLEYDDDRFEDYLETFEDY